jgi:hypothetical protein
MCEVPIGSTLSTTKKKKKKGRKKKKRKRKTKTSKQTKNPTQCSAQTQDVLPISTPLMEGTLSSHASLHKESPRKAQLSPADGETLGVFPKASPDSSGQHCKGSSSQGKKRKRQRKTVLMTRSCTEKPTRMANS